MFGNGLINFDMPYFHVLENTRQTNEMESIIIEPPAIGEIEQDVTDYGLADQRNLPIWQTISTIQVLVMVWAAVALAILAYHAWRYIGFKKLIERWGVVVKDEQTLSVLQDIQTEKGIAKKQIGLKKCDFISTSMIVGFFRPIILLPCKEFDSDELALIFRHELIHYKRGDLFAKLLSLIAISLNWFNPAVYFMSAAMQADCEASCDEAVISDVGSESKQFYAEIIIDMIGSKRAGGTVLSTCFYGSKNGIKKRMEAIMDTSGSVRKIAFSALLVLILLVILTGSIIAFSSPSPSEQQALPEAQVPSEQQNTGQITSQRAREIASEFVGYGAVYDIRAFIENEILIFEVEIRQNAVQYTVIINAENGSIMRLDTYEYEADITGQITVEIENVEVIPEPTTQPTPQPTATPTPQPTPDGDNGNRHSSEQGNRPSNPVISLERAIEIAYADIDARGINASFRNDSGMSWERGQWVWELEFRTQGERMPIIEFYINVDNGNIVKFEWDD